MVRRGFWHLPWHLSWLIVVAAVTQELSFARSAEPATPVVAAAGDVACSPGDEETLDKCHQQETSDLIAADPTITDVLVLGDNQYERGSLADYLAVYDPTWGRFKAITYPSVGNHEYRTTNAQGYRDYFGYPSGPLWYSFDLGDWHVVALDSNCGKVVGRCSVSSPQGEFLEQDLTEDSHVCELLYWHAPRFSSFKKRVGLRGFWQIAYDHGVDVILNGHGHAYERYSLQTPAGTADPVGGIRQFVVGTGGKSHDDPCCPRANIEAIDNTTFGVLRMTLGPTGYEWQFVPDLTSGAFTDQGAQQCH